MLCLPLSVAGAVQKADTQLVFKHFDGRNDGGVRAVQLERCGLKASFGDNGVKALQMVDGHTLHWFPLQ